MRRVTTLLCRLGVFAVFMLAGVLPVSGFERIVSGLDAYDAGDFLLASRLWENDASTLQQASETAYDKKVASFAYVLSSMAAARAKHKDAYSLWGKAESLLAEVGTRWSEQAVEYRAAVARLANPAAAQVSFEEGALVQLSASDEQLRRLSGTGVFNFEKPPAGLTGGESTSAQQPPTAEQASAEDDGRRVLSNRSPGFTSELASLDGTSQNTTENSDPEEMLTRGTRFESAPVPAASSSEGSSVLLFRQAVAADGSTASSVQDDDPRVDVSAGRSLSSARVIDAPTDTVLSNRGGVPIGQQLSTDELLWARVAWRYFEEAEQSVSGLADSHPGHARVSLWEIGSHLAALISAHQLEVITDLGFSQRVELLLDALEELPLYDGALPNRNYTTDTVEILDASGRAAPIGSGWSALDIGRLLIWLKIMATYYPVYAETASSIVTGWDLTKAVDGTSLIGAFRRKSGVELYREGRFGFEHYAAQGFVLWGAMSQPPGFENVRQVAVEGERFSVDQRANSPTNGYALMLLQTEFGCYAPTLCDSLSAALSLQRAASKRRGIPIAVSDYHLDKAPWFATTNFALEGSDWRSLSVEGGRLPDAQLSLLTTKAAFFSDVLDSDSTRMMSVVGDRLQSPGGFLEGEYIDGSVNRTLSLSTNAAVLQALWYRQHGGPFLQETVSLGGQGERKILSVRRF